MGGKRRHEEATRPRDLALQGGERGGRDHPAEVAVRLERVLDRKVLRPAKVETAARGERPEPPGGGARGEVRGGGLRAVCQMCGGPKEAEEQLGEPMPSAGESRRCLRRPQAPRDGGAAAKGVAHAVPVVRLRGVLHPAGAGHAVGAGPHRRGRGELG